MALTKISTDGVKDDAITKSKIPANQIEASELADNAVDTNAIADQAVSLSKLSHGTSSNDGKFLRANNGADPSFETVSIPAGTTINNNANNRVITGSGTANTLEGEAALTFDGTNFNFSRQDAGDARMYIYGGEGGDARLLLASDEGDDHIDTWEIRAQSADNNLAIYQFGGGSYNKRLTIDTDANNGDVIVNTGNLVIGTSGKGIDFSATANSSGTMGSELLDSYEEGTWSPTINVGSYTTFLTNRYIKIGRLVHLHGGLIFNNNTSSTRVEISNIPFTTQSSQYVGNVWLRRTSTGERNWNMILGEAGQNVLGIFRDSNGGHSDMGGHLSYSDFGSSATYFNYSITYIAAS